MTAFRDPAPPPCPRCRASRLTRMVCECGALEALSSDAFEVLGLSRTWALDRAELEQRFAAIRRQLEAQTPETGSDAWQRREEALAALHAARRVLADPLERAGALLAFYGGIERVEPMDSPELLSQEMEIRKALQEADARDGALREAQERLGSCLVAAGQSFSRLERALVEEIAAAVNALAAAKHWRRVVDEIGGRREPVRKTERPTSSRPRDAV